MGTSGRFWRTSSLSSPMGFSDAYDSTTAPELKSNQVTVAKEHCFNQDTKLQQRKPRRSLWTRCIPEQREVSACYL
jgi:hypothetical protein